MNPTSNSPQGEPSMTTDPDSPPKGYWGGTTKALIILMYLAFKGDQPSSSPSG
jgi:hypothetical protein